MFKQRPILLLLLLLPLLCFNIKDSHDWGDDFAQYLIQSVNIIDSKPQTENGLIFSESAESFAVRAYPIGFPLLISPVVAISGTQIKPLLILESIFLILLALLCWYYFRKYFSDGLSLLLVIFLSYHAFTINLKAQILSEIPFAFVLMSIIHFIETEKKTHLFWISLGVLCAFLASIRLIGFVIFPALISYFIYENLKNRGSKQSLIIIPLKSIFFLCFSGLLSFLILNVWLFDIPVSIVSFYQQAGISHEINFFGNLYSYLIEASQIFQIPHLQNLLIWKFLFPAILFVGFIYSFTKKYSIEHFIFLFYLIILGFYPYTSGGFRFLFPVFPFLIIYFFNAFVYSTKKFSESFRTICLYSLAFVLLYAQINPLYLIWKERETIVIGPQSADAQEMFAFIRNNTDTNSVIVFPRVRAMSIYSERSSTYLLQQNSPEENIELCKNLKVQFLVLPKGKHKEQLFDPVLWNCLDNNRHILQLLWENEGFEVYRMAKS